MLNKKNNNILLSLLNIKIKNFRISIFIEEVQSPAKYPLPPMVEDFANRREFLVLVI